MPVPYFFSWYKLSNGQSINSPTKFFQINDALGFYDIFGLSHPFWSLLNRVARVSNCAFQLPVWMKKRIFKTHHFQNGLSTDRFIKNLKQINSFQLEKLYSSKTIDSLLALMLMCIAHQYRSGKKVSRRVEKYFYAQFLYLMVFKYDIRLLDEFYIYIFYSLESNSLFTDQAFVSYVTESSKALAKKEQEKYVNQAIIIYLNKHKAHPYFHAYGK